VVLVNGDSPYLLQQVQRIEPTAFVREYQGRRFIQAGDFPSEANAQQRLVVLSQQGIGAQVIYLGGGVSNPSLVGINPQAVVQDLAKIPHFQVVVPTSPNNFGTITTKMVAMGVRPEAIQAKRAPLGPHVSVGPFIQQGEAESVSRYLRAGGMDARVYYAR
jgi:hypothetical protein